MTSSLSSGTHTHTHTHTHTVTVRVQYLLSITGLAELSSSLRSENYIFGKFDTFCRRLEQIADMATILQDLAALPEVRVEGMEKIYARYQTIVNTTKAKTYNVLDHRKLEVRAGPSDTF